VRAPVMALDRNRAVVSVCKDCDLEVLTPSFRVKLCVLEFSNFSYSSFPLYFNVSSIEE